MASDVNHGKAVLKPQTDLSETRHCSIKFMILTQRRSNRGQQ